MFQTIFFLTAIFLSLSSFAGSVQYCENNTNTAVEYEACMDKSNDVPEQQADRNLGAEGRCQDPRMTPQERENCVTQEAQARQARAKKRSQEEAEAGALTETKKPTCNTDLVISICRNSYNRSVEEKTDQNAKSCETACSLGTFENKNRLVSCDAQARAKVSQFVSSKRPYCGTGGAQKLPEDVAAETQEAKVEADKLALKRTQAGENAEEALINGSIPGNQFSNNYSSGACVGADYDISVCRVKSRDGSESIYYTDSSGRIYPSYRDAAVGENWQGPRVPEGWTPPAPAVVADPVVPGGSASGATTRGTTTVDPGRTVTSKDDTGGSGALPPPAAAEPAKTQPAPQAPAASNNGGSATGGASPAVAGGTASGGSGSSAFSNPYANTSLAANSNKSSNTSFAALSEKSSGDFRDEGVGADGSGGSGFDGGGFNNRSGGYRGGSSEGVNRDAPAGRSSLGSGGVAVASNNVAKDPTTKSKLEDLGGSTFQSGFHKPTGKEPLSPSSLNKAKGLLAKMNKEKRKKVMDQCKGDMSCIASILGVSKSRRSGGRGLASVPGQALPQGVWSGYTDILSHMAKVHDKIPINYDGEID